MVDEYLSEGLSEGEAINKTIVQMGNASLVGKQLDRVHRPKLDWNIILLSFFFVSLGLLSIYSMKNQELLSVPFFVSEIIYALLGMAILIGLYFFDCRKSEAYSKQIYLGTVLILAVTYFSGTIVNGKHWFSIAGVYIDFVGISPLLFNLALAGILNKWDWSESKKLLLGLLLCIMPLVFILANGSLAAGVIYSITCIVLLITAGAGYKIAVLTMSLMMSITTLPIITSPYRLKRLIAFINPMEDPQGNGYIHIQLKNLINSSGFYGQGGTLEPKILPEFHTDFIFTYITFTFGWIVAVILAALILVFLIRITCLASIVKNDYAKLILVGFVAIFTVQFVWNISMNLGFAPISEVGLPFISYGGSQLVLNSIAMGVISSIYRRRFISKNLTINS